ncbi:ECF transporter S component [Acidaminobacter sp. JC074]|uniref:ECF transporter S component n=1 Tax=Acidaminobacter sp. JC074 TaxID=2530199 RepID=UPI001F0D3959|nr:ECF transporter S component [Acidaminobacter sp. JC074]MCH4886481.1 ECF transporter S component [Acidaminobacter sp. JC074]
MEQTRTQTNKTKDMVISALLITLVFVATRFINIRLPISINGGLIHAGNTMLFLAAIVFGKKKGAIAGAFGMGLFDVLSGWLAWTPFTFLVRGVMGYIIGHIAWMNGKEGNSFTLNLIGIIVGGLWMLVGYYFTEVLLYGNWVAPFTSIPGNITQIVFGALVGLPLVIALKKTKVV